MNKEIRSLQTPIETENRHITGYGIIFESESADIGFIEVIARGAITQEDIDNSDIFFYYNHDNMEVLARSMYGSGSLKLTVDEIGVKYEFEAPNTQRGNELIEHIRRGELWGSSFGFIMPLDGTGQKWEKRDDKFYRTITRIGELLEISCVFSPAYPDTTCQNRGYDKFMNDLEDKEYEDYIINKMDTHLNEIFEMVR